MSLVNFAFKEEYKRVANLGDKLSEIESLIDWKPFRS
ncbi:MAG: IS5/IS1182 family transposase, partial [Halobacteriota archaeon]